MIYVQSLSHSKWECKCHGGFITKCRRRTISNAAEAGSVTGRWILIRSMSAMLLAGKYGEQKRNYAGQDF